jgi:hypothetical protein
MLVVGKFVLTLLQRAFFPRRARTAGRSQIREVSFILGATAVTVGVFKEQYALLSITLNPFLFPSSPLDRSTPVEDARLLVAARSHGPVQAPLGESLREHVVVIGCGLMGQHLVHALCQGESLLVIEQDISVLKKKP